MVWSTKCVRGQSETRQALADDSAREDLLAKDVRVPAMVGELTEDLEMHPVHRAGPPRWPVTTSSNARPATVVRAVAQACR
jgi:hypothetical protein